MDTREVRRSQTGSEQNRKPRINPFTYFGLPRSLELITINDIERAYEGMPEGKERDDYYRHALFLFNLSQISNSSFLKVTTLLGRSYEDMYDSVEASIKQLEEQRKNNSK